MMVKVSLKEPGHRELWKDEALLGADCPSLEPWYLMVPEKFLLEEPRQMVLQAASS